MSGEIVINKHTFLDDTSVAATDWVPVDYRYAGIQQRSVYGTKNTADEIVVEVRIETAETSVMTTATSWGSGVTNFGAVLQGPFTDLRVRKVGSSAAATVVGIV